MQLGHAKVRALICLFAAILLSACNPAVDEFDRVFTDRPTAQVDHVRVKVGEPVEVMLSVNLLMFPQSRIPEARLGDVSLGICVFNSVDEQEEPEGYGLCHPLKDPTPLSSNLTILDEGMYFLAAGDVVLERGETRTLRHTFTFTSSQPGEVHLHPTLKCIQFYQEGYPTPDMVGNQEFVTVTFE